MAGGKLTPRQKMINMMYLVLTALLAMNISKEVMNSFAIIDKGLRKTNTSFTAKNEILYAAFEKARLADPNKVQKYFDHAMAVKDRSQKMYDYLENVKKELIKELEKKEETQIETKAGKDSTVKIVEDVMVMENKDDYNTPTHFLMGDADQEAIPNTRAYDLKEQIKKYKTDLMTHVDAKDKASIKLGLDIGNIYSVHEGKEITWESNVFYHNPAVAVIAMMTKMQNDVKNAEADIVNSLYKRIDVSSYKFDTLSARVIANSNYVLLGEEYHAEIFLAAFSTTSNPKVILGDVDSVKNEIKGSKDTSAVKVAHGIGTYTFSPTAEGTVKYGGLIGMKDPADPTKTNWYPFHSEYKAARPAIVVSPDKMNVFYIGVENPVSISVPGIAAEDLQPSLSGGSMSGSRGKYIVKPSSGAKEATVNVSARTSHGVKSMGPGIKFRVKPVPNPVAEFCGKRGSETISTAQLSVATSVLAKLDNFEFDLKFPVISFNVSMTVNGQVIDSPCTGPSLTSQASSLLKKAKRGMKVYIENVKVKKPDGSTVDIGGVGLKVI